MDLTELFKTLAAGEDSRHQFKRDVTNSDSLAQEIVAFSNSGGGQLFLGVEDDGTVHGLSISDVQRLNQLISNTASQNVNPPVNPVTENIPTDEGLVLVITVPDGIRKPYTTQGTILVKNGADKRKVTAVEEMQRMFQASLLVHADETPVTGTSVADVDRDVFHRYLADEFGEESPGEISTLLKNMNLMRDGQLTTAGVLLFAKRPEFRLPAFVVKAVAFPGSDLFGESYDDSRDLKGRLDEVFRGALSFLLNNVPHRQPSGKSVNSIGEPVVPKIVFEELLANALIHRDYFISAPIRLFKFSDRIEIISPGHLPNNLTVENIKAGNSNMRNPILASYATRLLPYRGIGSGIRRALAAYPNIEFEDDRSGNLFKATVWI